MKLKEKMKRFWTLDVHGHEGFTLVELIIVIAILAILSGVAIAGYSAYIEKANKAADESLLYEINLAFQSACVMAGVDINTVTSAKFDMDTMLVTEVNGDASHPIAGVGGLFDEYFDVSNAKFKVIENIAFEALQHKFMDAAEVGAYSYGGGTIYLSAENIALLKESTYADMGMEDLMDRIASVTSFVSLAADVALQDEEFLKSMAGSLGITVEGNEDWMDDAYAKAMEMAAAMYEANPEKYADKNAAYNALVSNALVMYAAQSTVDQTSTASSVLSTLGDGTSFSALIDEAKAGNATNFAAQGAMAYAMYTAYAYRNGNENPSVQDILDALQTENSDFADYINGTGNYTNGESAADLAGYLAALEMMESSMDDEDALETLLTNGFNDPELVALLQAAMGESNP